MTLYNLKSVLDDFRITKFDADLNPESSYLLTNEDGVLKCECPAGTRPTCRHRQMLPRMLADDIADTEWFYDFDTGNIVSYDGLLRPPKIAFAIIHIAESAPEGLPTEPAPTIDTSLIDDKPEDNFRDYLHKQGKVPKHLAPHEVHTAKNPWRRF